MEIAVVVQFAIATLLPAVACIVLTLLRRLPAVQRIPYWGWQVLVGVVFGAIAVYGTEAGIPVNGAIMNVRDAAPLAAGLLFGGPAGIIAGVIGGVERWVAVMWGAGEFTRVACSLGTVFAGLYAAALRKFMFERHIPNLAFSFATGVVVEVLHLMLVFLTNLDQLSRAFEVTQACAMPMTICVGLSTLLCSLTMTLLSRKPLITPPGERNVVRILHSRMLIGVVAAFLITVGCTAMLQAGLARTQVSDLLKLNIQDVESDIRDVSDANLLRLTRNVAAALPVAGKATNEECVRLAVELQVAEVDVIDANGVIVASSDPSLVGFDMASGEQSAEFLALLPGSGTDQLVQSYQPMAFDSGAWRKYAGVAVEDGFVQVGYDSSNFLDVLFSQAEASVKNRHVGQTGVLVAIDEAGAIITARNDISNETAERLSADASAVGPGELFTTRLADEECFGMYQQVEGYRVIGLLPFSEANYSRDVSVLITAFMEVLIFAALFLVIYAVVKQVVVRGIRKMNGQLGQITLGNLDVEVDVREASELASLSDDINHTVGVLKDSLALVKADLDVASDVQASSLPDITQAIAERSEFDLFASMEPAKEVGGDFYDFFMADDDHLVLVVADVSGKGVPAALFMMLSKTVIKMEALSGFAPDQVLYRANADLSEKNNDDMFTTAWVGVLEISTGTLTYADAGHEKLALYRDGKWELPDKPNRAVALSVFSQDDYNELPEKYHFRSHTVMLQPGDAIFQYTDGVTEATDADTELFGEERLLDALNGASSADPVVVLPHVRESIGAFVKDAPQFDDITMLGLLYKG